MMGGAEGGGGGRDAAIARLLLRAEIEDFYYAEAALLDAHRYSAWLDLFTADARYQIPIQQDLMLEGRRAEAEAPGDEVTAFADDDRWALELKVRQREDKKHWCENPPSRLRHFVANVRVERDAGEKLDVRSSILVYRNRVGNEVDLWSGERADTLSRVEGGLRIARRRVLLDQGVLLSKNLSVFF